jgi:L-lactate dehydrogenase complex protein LldG
MSGPATPFNPLDADIQQISDLIAAQGVLASRAANLNGAAREIARLQQELDAPEVLVAGETMRQFPAFMNALDDAGVNWHVPESLERSLDAALGVTLVAGAVVETGSVVLVEPSPADRGVSLISLNAIMLIPVGRIVPGLDEAMEIVAEAARQGQYASFVTGPSRTADIEMSLTVGVQGPKRVYYLFVDSLR